MRQLNHDLKRLQDDQPKRRYATQRDRSYLLAQAADALHELGFRRLRATGLRRKHVNALVREWQARGLSVGTMNPSYAVRKILLYQYVEDGRFVRLPLLFARSVDSLASRVRLAGWRAGGGPDGRMAGYRRAGV